MQVILHHQSTVNVHPLERAASVVSGGALTLSGVRGGWFGLAKTLTGLAMMQRGITGHCYMYQALGVRSAPKNGNTSVPYELGVRARAAVTINQPRDRVFQFWRDLENLPKFMAHLVSVNRLGGDRSHWVAEGPAGKRIEWDAETINEIENELIAWRSLEGSTVDSAGSVRFKDAPGGRGTEIHVELQYNPPGGALGAYIARIFGKEPEQEIEGDLIRLKHYLETGEIATTAGQSKGPRRQARQPQKERRLSKRWPQEELA